MSDRKEIFRLKLAIEEDGKIGHGSRALGLRVCSYVYNHAQLRWQPEEPFPLPWTLCSELLWGICERQAYNMLRELVDRGHMAYEGILGCPGKSHFRLIIPPVSSVTDRAAKNCRPGTAKNCRPKAAKNSRARSAMKRSPLISNSLREGIVNSNGRNNSALRATGNEGMNQQPPAADNVERLRAQAEEHFKNFRKEQRHA